MKALTLAVSLFLAVPACAKPKVLTFKNVGAPIDTSQWDDITSSYPLVFKSAGFHTVAALVYDYKLNVCRQQGDLEEAFRILRAEFDRVAEERDRLRYGNATVDRWKRESQERAEHRTKWYINDRWSLEVWARPIIDSPRSDDPIEFNPAVVGGSLAFGDVTHRWPKGQCTAEEAVFLVVGFWPFVKCYDMDGVQTWRWGW